LLRESFFLFDKINVNWHLKNTPPHGNMDYAIFHFHGLVFSHNQHSMMIDEHDSFAKRKLGKSNQLEHGLGESYR
jgi:hypothetical protein